MPNRHSLLVLLAMSLLAWPLAALAADPVTWYSLDGGGVTRVTAGGFALGGTIGQPDAGSLSGGAYALRGGFWHGGASGTVGVDDGPATIQRFAFARPWPNPVRATSRVAFDLPRAARVALTIFDVSGRAVRTWDFGRLLPGHQERVWHAVDAGGRPMSSGVYFLRLDAERDRGVHKVIVIR